MSEAKDSKPESYDLLDVVGGGLEKCARTLFGQPGDCDITSSIEKSKSLNNQGGDLKRSEEMEESRGDAEAERSEASSVLPPILSTAAIKISNIAAPEMPDIGGQIEKMTAKVLAVGDCQSREVPYLKSLWAIGNTNNEATQRTNTISKIKDKGSDRLDDASIDSVLSYSSSVDCCALLDTQEREFDRETFWENDGSDEEEEDDDVPNDGATPSASALLVEVATTIDTFKASRNSAVPIIEDPTFAINDEKEITEPEFLLMNTVRSRKSHSPANWSGEEAPIFSSASYESDTSTVTRGAGCSIHKGRRWTSHLRDRTSGGKKKPHVLKHCERGRCPAAPDHATRMMNKASSTLSYAHSSALEAIKGKRWQVLLNLVKANTHILSLHSSAIRGGTILHALAASDDAPDAIVLQILSICPNLAGCLDDTDSTPLHLVAKRSKRPGLVKLFSDYHAPSVSIQNANGDSALHFAASAASEESTLILLNANKNMLTIPNQKQQIPLHAACSCPCPSIQVIRSLLSHHKAIGVLPSSVDKAGNTPLCAAIKNNDSTKIVPVFCKEFPELFRLGNTDTGKSLPLHTALLQPDIDTRTLLCIIEAGPDAAAVPLPSGDLPIVVATRRGLSDDIIYSLLVQDLPIAILGPDEKGVSMKKHNYSWHHVLTSCQESYCNVVNGVLQASNHWQRIALALSPSLFGHLSYNSCSEPMRKSFDVALRIGGRFQIQLLDDIESFSIDREYNVLSAADTAPLKNSDGDEHSNSSDVTIRCYANEKKIVDELFVRRGHRVSDVYAERLILHLPSDQHLVPTPFPLIFEKPKETFRAFLTEMNEANEKSSDEVKLEEINQRRRQVFLRIAKCLQHFHEKGLTHSNISPENIGLFEDGWKLMLIGGSTPIFTAIGGKGGSYVPPEAVARVKPMAPNDACQDGAFNSDVDVSGGKSAKFLNSRRQVGRKWGVLFSLTDLGLQKSRPESADVAISNAEHHQTLLFQPKLSQVWTYRIAPDFPSHPSFDIFGFGLLFVQSYLASDSLLPTTQEKPNETYMSKAYGFNNEHLKIIKEKIEAIGGKEAAHLAAMTLQPSPTKRAQTMMEILDHDYFAHGSY